MGKRRTHDEAFKAKVALEAVKGETLCVNNVEFTGKLEAARVRISMDGLGRVFDNIFIERLWRSVKQEEAYTKSYETVRDARDGLARYFRLYNT